MWLLLMKLAAAIALLVQPEPIPEPEPIYAPFGESFYATHYGPSYNGQTMGCGGLYSSENSTILAVPMAMNSQIRCGQEFRITAPNGNVLIVNRSDTCPGCGNKTFDLSEAGIKQLCGYECDTISGLKVEVRND